MIKIAKLCFKYVIFTRKVTKFNLLLINVPIWNQTNKISSHNKGAGLFQKARRTKEQAAGRGTSRYPNGIKSWPEPIGNWILKKIIFLRHKISHLWWKIAIVWAIFGQFWPVFADFLVSVTQLCSLWEPFQPEHSWPMWGQGLKPF